MTVGERLLGLVADVDGALFGVPGGQTLPLYAASRSAGVRHLVVRDEFAATAGAMGADGRRIARSHFIVSTIADALETPGPSVVEVSVSP